MQKHCNPWFCPFLASLSPSPSLSPSRDMDMRCTRSGSMGTTTLSWQDNQLARPVTTFASGSQPDTSTMLLTKSRKCVVDEVSERLRLSVLLPKPAFSCSFFLRVFSSWLSSSAASRCRRQLDKSTIPLLLSCALNWSTVCAQTQSPRTM